MAAHLRRQGHAVNHKRVQRLMGVMALQAIYPRAQTSRPAPGHPVYP
ncbi:MAG: IS3 family transposase, partial [Chloroflexi bacterium]|nr:IS3 family transposase [Chloroflexota bacterium]